ncbi:hypothetical protein ACHAWF_012328 [Thalassiosira exigua]
MPRSSPPSESSTWKTQNSLLEPTSPTDETYRAAKAAAEEARKLDHHPPKAKTSLFGSFFHRGSKTGSNSSAHGISSHSSHGGVVGSPGGVPIKRDGSSGSAASVGGSAVGPSPLAPTRELPDVPAYGSPRAADGDGSTGDGSTCGGDRAEQDAAAYLEQDRRRMEEEGRRREAEAERRRQEAEDAERRRAEEEAAERRRREKEEERERRLAEERERRRSPRQKLREALDHLADAARAKADAAAALRGRRAGLVGEMAAAAKAERYEAQRVKFAEVQQTLAVEEEDFESADRLGTVIEGHSKERDAHSANRARIAKEITDLDQEREEASRAVAACFDEARAKLQELEEEVDDRAKEEGVLDQFEKTSKRLSSETERLTNDLKHIERDEAVLKEEQKELGGRITEETKEFDEKCTEASAKLEEVNETIKSLRQQLLEAETKASDLTGEIATYQQSIDNVKSKYSRQLGRLEKKEKSVKESRSDWESEKESIEKAQAAHEAVVAAHSEDMLNRENLIKDIQTESATAKDLAGIVSSAFADVADPEGDGPDLDNVDGEVLKYEAAVNEANQNVIAAETNIENLQEEISSIGVRLPILESEKKLAASKRDFKAAGKASKGIKEALARKQLCQAELEGDAMERKKFAKDELEKITTLLEEKKNIASKKKKEAGMDRMDLLRENIDELKSMLGKIGTDSKLDDAEEDAVNVSCVGAFVIESQISILEAEGKSLGEKYGGWDTQSADVVEESSVQSAPTFDSASANDDDTSEIVIDNALMEKYHSLMDQIKDIESAIEEAAEEEDFDEAAELEEQAQIVREEFESCGFSLAKFERALEEFKDKPSDSAAPDTRASPDNGDDPKKAIEAAILEKYVSLSAEIKKLELMIETAVSDDDFDKATELEAKVQSARSEIESLGFTIDDLEEAIQNGSSTSSRGDGDNDEGEDAVNDLTAACDELDHENKTDTTQNSNDMRANGVSAYHDKEDVGDNEDEEAPTPSDDKPQQYL